MHTQCICMYNILYKQSILIRTHISFGQKNWSTRILKVATPGELTISSGRLFQYFTTMLENKMLPAVSMIYASDNLKPFMHSPNKM